MQLQLGSEVKLETGLSVTVVGEVDIIDNGRQMKKVVGRLSTPQFVKGSTTLLCYHLFSISEVQQ